MARKMKLSGAQLNYVAKRAAYDVAHREYLANSDKIDAEGERLGLETPYCILPEDHPLMIEGQRLLDIENEHKRAMYAAAAALFDWASETVLTKMGTPQQKTEIRDAVAKVKTMAYVERPFEDLVKISLQLAA